MTVSICCDVELFKDGLIMGRAHYDLVVCAKSVRQNVRRKRHAKRIVKAAKIVVRSLAIVLDWSNEIREEP